MEAVEERTRADLLRVNAQANVWWAEMLSTWLGLGSVQQRLAKARLNKEAQVWRVAMGVQGERERDPVSWGRREAVRRAMEKRAEVRDKCRGKGTLYRGLWMELEEVMDDVN